MEAVNIEKLYFYYEDNNKNPVIEHLSLIIPKGSVTAVLGPNGAGKTTLLAILLGLLSPASGRIYLFGKLRKDYTNIELRQMIGMVSQNETIPFDLSVMEYVLLGRAPYLHMLGLPGQQEIAMAVNAMKTAGIDHMDYRAVPSLSSGERQLASIARVLAQMPDILLFDEPTSHLDLPNSRKILSLMKTIARKDKTVVFTTHDPNAASAIADYMVLLGFDGMIAAGRTAEIFTEKNLSNTYGEHLEILQTERGPVILAI